MFGIVIVTHNHRNAVARCLDSVSRAWAGQSCEIVVRDCGSSDGSAQVAESHPLRVTVVRGENVGFGAACNEAAARLPSTVSHVLFLNPDTELMFTVEWLEHEIRDREFGCVGLRQVDFDDEIVWCWDQFPTARLEWAKARNRPLLQRSPAGYEGDRSVDWVMGSLLLIPTAVFGMTGGFDTQFFLFNEEIDLCRRIRDLGFDVMYLNALHYRHVRGGKATLWREVVRLNSRRALDAKWLSRRETINCQLAHTYRWLRSLVAGPSTERRYAVPRLLATWGLLRGVVAGLEQGRVRLSLPVRGRPRDRT